MAAVNIPKASALDQTQYATAYLRRLQKSRVSEVIFEDAVLVYATAKSPTEADGDRLLAELEEPPRQPQVRKAILDVIFSVIAAGELPMRDVFTLVVDRLNLHEDDSMIADLKHAFLARMREDGIDDAASVKLEEIHQRLTYVDQQID